MAISSHHSLRSLHPPCHKYGYICKCNYSIVLRFSALLDSSLLFSTSPLDPLLSLKCPRLFLATPLLVRPVCLTDYRAPVAQVTRVTNLAGVELHIIASAPWLISALERKRRRSPPPPPPPSKNTPTSLPASLQRSRAAAKTLHLVGGRRLWRDQSQGREQLRALGIRERGFLLLSPIF